MLGTETREQRLAREQREEFEARIAKALGHHFRVRIMEILNERDASPSEVARKIGKKPENLNYHFKVLADLECIEMVDVIPASGRPRKVYRSLQSTMFADLAWSALSRSQREGISKTMLQNALRRVGDALDAETFDRKEDRHLSHQTVSVDWPGWDEIRALMAETMNSIAKIANRAEGRAKEEERFPATAVLLSFESPRMYEKAPDA